MLIRSLDLLIDRPMDGLVTIAAFLAALVAAITFHEFSHALSANRLGDLTATRQGRLSLNPIAHLDPLGSVMILLAGFGWGKPVPVNAYNLQAGERSGMALVAAAGPVSNVLMALLLSVPARVGLVALPVVGYAPFSGGPGELAGYFLQTIIYLNIVLAAFNLLPIAPLDGFKVALGLLPREAAAPFARLERYGPMILLGLILLDYVMPGRGILWTILGPIVRGLGRLAPV